MELHIHIKFRAFGIDFGTVDLIRALPPYLQVVGVLVGPHVIVNERGVLLELVPVGVTSNSVVSHAIPGEAVPTPVAAVAHGS